MIAQPQRNFGRGRTLQSVTPLPEAVTALPQSASTGWQSASGLSSLEGQVQIFTSAHRHFFTHVLSQALRDAGQGTAVLIVQFFKGGIDRGPQNPTHLGQNLDWVRCRLPYSLNAAPQSPEECEAVRELWEFTQDAVQSERYEQMILEELSLAVFHRIVPEQEVLELFAHRPRSMDITLIGQQMPQALLQAANQVTELRNLFEFPGDAAPYPSLPTVPPKPVEISREAGRKAGRKASLEASLEAAQEMSLEEAGRAVRKYQEVSPGQICIPGLAQNGDDGQR